MFARRVVMVVGCFFFSTMLCRAAEADKDKSLPEELAKAQKLVADELDKLKANGARVNPVQDSAVAKVVGDFQFVAVIFSPFPVARPAPKGFKAANVYAVGKDGKLQLMSDPGELEKFFTANATPAKDEKSAKDVLSAWLRLTQEFSQDGFYQFALSADSLKVEKEKDGLRATGITAVVQENRNKGEVKATLTFDSAGKLILVAETRSVEPGDRPKQLR